MKKIALAFGIILTFFGCNSTDSSIPAPDVIFPLYPGNYWVYETTVYDSSGEILNTGLDTLKIFGMDKCGDYDCFPTGFTSDNVLENFTLIKGGLFQSTNDSLGPLIFKYPANAGDKYPGAYGNAIVDSVDAKSPSDRYPGNCMKYIFSRLEETGSGIRTVIYVALNVGIVAEFVYYMPDKGNEALTFSRILKKMG